MDALTSLRTAFAVFFLCFSTALLAQEADLKKAFKLLDKGKYDAAIEAFEAVEESDENYTLALFGLAQAWSAEENESRDFRKAAENVDSCRVRLKNAKGAQKKAWKEDFEFSAAGLNAVDNLIKKDYLEELKTTNSLRFVDDFLRRYPKASYTHKAQAGKKHNELFSKTAASSDDYLELCNLVQTHSDSLAKLPNKDILKSVRKRCFDAFLAKEGVDKLEDFAKKVSKHPLSAESASTRTDFAKAWKSTNLGDWLDFTIKYPYSGFSPLLSPKIDTQSGGDWQALKSKLSEKQFSALVQTKIMKGNLDPTAEDTHWAQWLEGAKLTAPAGLSNVQEVFKKAYQKRQWARCKQLLADLAPLFPKESAWFKRWSDYMNAPSENIAPASLGQLVNSSKGSEHLPVISGDGRHLYFCGQFRQDNLTSSTEDVFVTENKDGVWQKPELVKDLSTQVDNEAPLSITADGTRMFLFVSGKVHQSEKTATGWTKPQRVSGKVNNFGWVCQTQITPDGRALIFEAYEGSSANIDLYIAYMEEDGSWGEPKKLDNTINTAGWDRGPFLHPDGKTMYFCSAGHGAIGEMDVFKTTRLDETWAKWSTPVSLGYEINTFDNEWGYVISTDGSTAYFASGDRDAYNLYSVKLPATARPEKVVFCEVSVKDEKGNPVSAEVVVQELPSGKTHTLSRTDPKDGRALVTLTVGKHYGYYVKKSGFFPESFNVDLRNVPDNFSCKETVVVRPTCSDNILRNIFFDTGKFDLRPESGPELDRIAELVKNDKIALQISGHTDDVGDDASNLTLSQNRAEAVKKALVERGCAEAQLGATGFGKNKPIQKGTSDAARQKNRRVEISCKK